MPRSSPTCCRFAGALPELRAATVHDLRRRNLNRDRVASGVVRLIDLGLFRIGGEKYAELDHHYGATTLEKRHVTVTRGGIRFDYIAKEGKRREITVSDPAVVPTVRALASSDNGLDALFCLGARRHLAPAALARRERVHRGAGRRRTTPPRNSAPGTPPC